jgi:hypothetical protein
MAGWPFPFNFLPDHRSLIQMLATPQNAHKDKFAEVTKV